MNHRLELHRNLPRGTVTFLFTDIQGSTRLWREYPQAMPAALARHHAILQAAIEAHNGYVFQIIGDAFCAAFSTASDGIGAALQAQQGLQSEAWGETGQVRVRMALHSGAAELRAGDYTSGEYLSGMTLSRTARLLSAGHGDQVLLSQTARDLLIYDLPEGVTLLDLGEHRLRDLTHAEHLYQLSAPGLVAEFPPLKSLDNQLTNLPTQPNALLGRQAELQTLTQLLGSAEVRLLTLTGIGGIGKTRLALQTAAELLAVFPDGVYFVAMDQLTDAGLVAATIAQALSLELSVSQSIEEALQAHLHTRRTLLVLDNFEHLMPAASLVSDLLSACAQLKVLVTSRETLRLRGEQEFPLDPLSLPDMRQPQTPDQLAQFASVALFIQRAQVVCPDFKLDNASAPAVAEICAYLDGLPLAIELAAARLRLFTPQALLARLKAQPGLVMLSGGARDLPARQQTLQNTLEWSYNLLTPVEQALFRRLGVFAGGFTLEAVEAVCLPPDEEPGNTFELLTSLVEKSLVQVSEDGGEQPRFSLLFVLRQFALGLLDQAGELMACNQAHAEYYLALAELAEPELRTNDQTKWKAILEQEHDNLRAALGRAITNSELETAFRLADALGGFWIDHSYLREGLKWVEQLLASADIQNVSAELQANVLTDAAGLAYFLGDMRAAQEYFERCLEIRRASGDRRGIARALGNLGYNLALQGKTQSGVQFLEESIALFRETDDKRGLALTLDKRAIIAAGLGDYPFARELLNEGLVLMQGQGDHEGIGWALGALGNIELYQGNYDRAKELYEENVKISLALGQQIHTAEALGDVGMVLLLQGNLITARSNLEQAVKIFHEAGARWGIAITLEKLAGVAGAKGNHNRAVHLFGSAEALREITGEPLTPSDNIIYDPMVRDVRSKMSQEDFDTAWSAGRHMLDEGLDRVIAYALEPDEAPT